MKKKVCFKTWCSDGYRKIIDIEKLTKQLNYFHPDIPHFIYGDKEMAEDSYKFPWAREVVMMPISMMKYIDDYELVIHIDGDSTIVGPLDELINSDYDAAGVRNNHFGNGAGCHASITIPEVPWDKFLNAGLNALRSKEFLLEWLEGCKHLPWWDNEQTEYNRHFFKEKYKTIIIDDVGSNLSYGVSNVFGTNTHWDSWKDLYIKNGEMYQINPIGEEVKVKVLHMAGGGDVKAQVFQGKTMRQWIHEWVKPEVSEYIKMIES
jgi:hypothetical protein